MFDKDGNGLITKQELLEGLNKLGETMNEKDVLELI
jgi:Ca2+-binding EF-hand superfamily protein